jgi:hypothetical protein
MTKPNRPTLVFPNGGEDILTRAIEVSWLEPRPLSLDNLAVWYELYYAEDYDSLDEPDWKQIASLPEGTTKFEWKVGNYIRSERVRVGVCSINTRGERSEMSVSADDVRIRREFPVTPAVLSPVPQARYGNSVEILFDDAAIKNTFGQRAKYYIFFSSQKADIPFTPVAQKVPVGSGPLIWDTSLLKPSDDYILTVYLADDDGNKSAEVNIRDLQIVNEGFFLIDTKPPSGFIRINNGDEFTRDPDVTVRLFVYDETTGAHSMIFKEGDVGSTPESVVNLKFYQFIPDTDGNPVDGLKTLRVLFQDYGANRTSELHKSFRTVFERQNEDIADILLQKETGTLWIAKNGSIPTIYKIDETSNFQVTVPEQINSLGILNQTLYISVNTDTDTALVYRYNGESLNATISLSEANSEIISIATYKSVMYMGSLSGILYSYDQVSVDSVHTFDSPIQYLYSDGSLLYIVLRNSSKMFVYDGNAFTEVISDV